MALAPLIYTIWNRDMQFDPLDPIWPNRDRFVLSNGHASMLLWSVLFLTATQAVNVNYEQLGEAFGFPRRHPPFSSAREQGSRASRVSLGLGCRNDDRAAWPRRGNQRRNGPRQKWLAHRYNRPEFEIFNYRIYAVCGDGCLMEGVASEAASLAGHLGLDHLCWVYDNDHITIEGRTELTFTEDVAARFLAYGWNILRVSDANDLEHIEDALSTFRKTQGRPTLIILDSHIGYGSPHRQDTAAAHGEPLGDDEVKLVKRFYGWPEDAKFLVPDGVREHFAAGIGARGATLHGEWTNASPPTGPSTPIWQKRSISCSGASFLPAGTATFRSSPPTRRALRDAMHQEKC